MFSNDITLNPTTFGGANVNKVYSLIALGDGSSSIRRVSATAATTPETLTVSHRSVKDGAVDVDQHMIRLDLGFTDVLLGPVKFSCWLVIRNPLGTTILTNQLILDQIGRLIAFEQASGALDKILNKEP
jgi:hypothetical protein